MFYSFLTYVARIAFSLYFKKLYLFGAERIPDDKPVILACNHPSSFMEASLLATFLPRHLYFLTRGDVFRYKLLKFILRQTKQIPIYRFKDGFGNLRSNQQTFQTCYEKLSEGKMLLIFSEAKTKLEKRMRPIQRGTAKLALGALEYDPSMELCLVPVAVSFEDPRKAGSIVSFHVSPSLDIYKHADLIAGDQKEAIRRITDYISTEIGSHMVQIRDVEREKVTERLFEMHRNTSRIPVIPFMERKHTFNAEEIAIADMVHAMEEEKYNALENITNLYWEALGNARVPDRVVARAGKWSVLHHVIHLLGTIGYIPGRILNAVPFAAYHQWIRPLITAEPFQGPVKAFVGFILAALFYSVLVIILLLFFGSIGVMVASIAIVLGIFAFKAGEWIREGWGQWRFLLLPKQSRKALIDLRRHVTSLVSSDR